MITIIIILSLPVILSWILFAPLILKVDTESEDYSVRIPGIIKASVIQDDSEVYMKIRILFVPFRIRPSRFAPTQTKKKPKRKRISTGNLKYRIIAFKDIIRSFRLRNLQINMDTEDFLLNANLVPVLMLAKTDRINLNVNFMDANSLIMDLRNRLANLLWTGIKYKYRTIVKP